MPKVLVNSVLQAFAYKACYFYNFRGEVNAGEVLPSSVDLPNRHPRAYICEFT